MSSSDKNELSVGGEKQQETSLVVNDAVNMSLKIDFNQESLTKMAMSPYKDFLQSEGRQTDEARKQLNAQVEEIRSKISKLTDCDNFKLREEDEQLLSAIQAADEFNEYAAKIENVSFDRKKNEEEDHILIGVAIESGSNKEIKFRYRYRIELPEEILTLRTYLNNLKAETESILARRSRINSLLAELPSNSEELGAQFLRAHLKGLFSNQGDILKVAEDTSSALIEKAVEYIGGPNVVDGKVRS